MLLELQIKNFAIVENLQLDFSPKLSVITGETGAGKSIMIDALSLALGARADSQSLRPGAERCDVTATFDIQHNDQAKQYLQENELDSGQDCILRRTINKEGRSRAYINGEAVTLQQCRELGELLVDIHGQHAQHALLKTDTQRHALDQFAKHESLLTQVKQAHQRWHQLQQELSSLQQAGQDKNYCELLRYQCQELDELDMQDNELKQLELEHKQLTAAESSIEQCQKSLQLISDDDQSAVLLLIPQAQQSLQALQQLHPGIKSAMELLNQAAIECEEARDELQAFLDKIEVNPERLHQVDQRLEKIYQCARKHHVKAAELPAMHQGLLQQLQNIDNSAERVQALQQAITQALTDYQTLAKKLSKKRVTAAKQLGQKVQAIIRQLGMPNGEIVFQCEFDAKQTPKADGLDHIQCLVRSNPGQELLPLSKVVSGGELSRISLAIQVTTAQQDHCTSLIFDEVDVGIGGSTAAIVGRLLRQLAEHAQVLCVTHQPQVAACGHHHFRVEKHSSKTTTRTQVLSLGTTDKIQELARMLGGVSITQQTIDHAQALLSEVDAG